MFAFDQWHLLVTAMELHRIHNVDLVIAYVQVCLSLSYKSDNGLRENFPALFNSTSIYVAAL
jgi:hypothetical protein